MTRSRTLAAALLALTACHRSPRAAVEEASFVADAAAKASAVAAAPAAPSATITTTTRCNSNEDASMISTSASYSQMYAGSARASRVHTPLRPLSGMHRVGALRPGSTARPRVLLVEPCGDHIAIDYFTGIEVRRTDLSGGFAKHGYDYGFTLNRFSSLTLVDGAVFVGAGQMTWAGQRGPLVAGSPYRGRATCAFRLDGDHTADITLLESIHAPHSAPTVPELYVSVTMLRAAGPTSPPPLLFERWEGEGVGAIGEDRRAAVAMQDGRFAVVALGGAKPGQHLVDKKLAFAPTDISIVEPWYALLEARGKDTVLHVLDIEARERWKIAVAFAVAQPPIDGAGGRIYLAGDGLAAIEDGHIVWQRPAGRVLATAFDDGSLAIAVGAQLQIVARDGSVRQVFRTEGDEAIETPPAIASDGAVWVATRTAVYVAR